MGLESPVRRAVHTCGCKCAESKLVLSCSDIFYDFLKAVEICDVFCCVSCFFQQRLVVDNTIVLNNVGDTSHLVAVHQCEAVVRQLSCDVGTRQVIAVILPACKSNRSVYLEQRRRVCLCHLGLQRFLIFSGRCCQDCHRHTCLFCISFSQLLPVLICLRLEVQIVYLALCVRAFSFRRTGASASGRQSCCHCHDQ